MGLGKAGQREVQKYLYSVPLVFIKKANLAKWEQLLNLVRWKVGVCSPERQRQEQTEAPRD